MGQVLSTRSPHSMPSKPCCEHDCCYRECRRRARKHRDKRGDGGAALDEFLWAAGDLLKEYVRDVKEKRKASTGNSHKRHDFVERETEDRRRLRGGYERYRLPEGIALEEGGGAFPGNEHGRYRYQDEGDEELSPMEQPQGSRSQHRNARRTRPRHGPGHRRRAHRSPSQQSFTPPGQAEGFGYANVDSFHGPSQPIGRTRHDRGPWQGSGSNGRGNGGHFSS